MQRLTRLSIIAVILTIFGVSGANAASITVSGKIAPDEVMVFLKDNEYIINKALVVGGTLIIEPGTRVVFYPNGRLIDSTGGRIIADGFADVQYTPNPELTNGENLDPIELSGSPENPNTPLSYNGYSDLNYFLHGRNNNTSATMTAPTVDFSGTKADPTVHTNKQGDIFHVILDTVDRRIKNLEYDGSGNLIPPVSGREVQVTYQQAMMFLAAKLDRDPAGDPNLRNFPWSRLGDRSVNINPEPITFVGQPTTNFSREFGHIIILPGARAAYFRNVVFRGFKKDTTVDNVPLYSTNQGTFGWAQNNQSPNWNRINNDIRKATNGSGGAITTFSARTWILNCTFQDNISRFRGGAIQFLEAPDGYPDLYGDNVDMRTVIGTYPLDKNPHVNDPDGSVSSINSNPLTGIPAIDYIDSDIAEPFSDVERAAYDDSRISIYLGRFRNNRFVSNEVVLADYGIRTIGNQTVGLDLDSARYPYSADYPNGAFGGAVYISGRAANEFKRMEINIGGNHSMRMDLNGDMSFDSSELIVFEDQDTFSAESNIADNRQTSGSSQGSKGGAMYIGEYTSVILSGHFSGNEAQSRYFTEVGTILDPASYSQGGAVYHVNSLGRLQLRGGPERETTNNATEFTSNIAGAGGAVYVDGNTQEMMSPLIGGTDNTLTTRNYGFNISFLDNIAHSHGGAVYTRRNMWVNGAGGVESNIIVGYGGNFHTKFWNNHAGLSGGGIHIDIPLGTPLRDDQRNTIVRRASFRANHVGMDIEGDARAFVRGGGAIYVINGDLNVVQATEFHSNVVRNGNGAAIAQISPKVSSQKFFVTDLDEVQYDSDGIAVAYSSNDDVFTWGDNVGYPADVRMLTRFFENEVVLDSDAEFLASQMGRGTTQEEMGIPKTTATLQDVDFFDENFGLAVGTGGEIVKINGGGRIWTYLNSETTFRLTGVEIIDQLTAVVVGHQGTILKTVDAGNTWTSRTSPAPNDNINDIQRIGTQILWAAANDGKVLNSTDRGETWTSFTAQPGIDLMGVYFVDNSFGYVVGEDGTVLKTTDGGSNWSVLNTTMTNDLNSVFFNGRNRGWIVGQGGAYAWTDDGGDTWNEVDPKITTRTLTRIIGSNQNTLYAIGTGSIILKSTDAGLNWDALQSSAPFSNNLYGISFSSDNIGFIVGDFGFVEKTTDAGDTWVEQEPIDDSFSDVTRYHQDTDLPENGIGLGGALYILDESSLDLDGRQDSVFFNRVRIQGNSAYTGAAVYSDNWDLKLIFNRSLITTNEATSEVGAMQNLIVGPIERDDDGNIEYNFASSDLAGAILYGEVLGPLPSAIYSEAANSIYNNNARFLIRLPDAPDTKGVLAGTTGLGFGGTDTLRGNYWGRTEANLSTDISNIIIDNVSYDFPNATPETFFVAGDGNTWLPFMNSWTAGDDPRMQGPHESLQRYTYETVPLRNLNQGGTDYDENTPDPSSVPENLLFSGHVYDIHDKGTDIKAADYSGRRMSPIEDFAVGIPPILKSFDDPAQPSNDKYVKRFVRDQFCLEDDRYSDFMSVLQREYAPNTDNEFFHPIGQPLYLEAEAEYNGDFVERLNNDPYLNNETVFFVINETTGDFIRTNLLQVSEEAPNQEVFRGRIDFVPDSSDRIARTLIRRTTEGLLNLGSGSDLLAALEDNPYNEDGATLPGRKYSNNENRFGQITNIFSNRPDLPAENNDRATYFAGERYRTLPVNVGDDIRVISRTVLWQEGVIPAFDRGIAFTISAGVEAPQFTGDIVSLRDNPVTEIRPTQDPNRPGELDTIEIEEYANTVFVREDRFYPAPDGFYGPMTRDSILSMTAVDSNNYYDPRALFDISSTSFTYLTYEWNLEANAGLNNWLMVDTLAANDGTGNQNIKDGAVGFQQFRGTPMNPYVVPGGEDVNVTVYSYPPHFRTIDSLKATFGWADDNDTLAKLIELYPDYFHAQSYTENARYLQQDTVDMANVDGRTFANDYEFKIFVVDSLPTWLDWDAQSQTITRNYTDGSVRDTQVVYDPSLRNCFSNVDDRLVANLTDKLRFQVDINTNDELEDAWAERVHQWDFRYGRTAYSFENLIISAGDTVVTDSTFLPIDDDNDETIINQVRPAWLATEYLYEYDSETDQDILGSDFTTNGQLNVRIDRDEALELISRPVDMNGALNTDTTMRIIVNDGHGGKLDLEFDILINLPPVITTETLEPAKEDERYNPQLLNVDRKINVEDPNFDQTHTFELIYEGDYPNGIPRDPCFPEAGNWEIGTDYFDDTPLWLSINEESGLLYGTPRVTDAPRQDRVSVLVTDSEGLTTVRVYDLQVDSTNHLPNISAIPSTECYDIGGEYSDTIRVIDIDLQRDEPGFEETLTIEVIEPPTGFEVTPSTITGVTDSLQTVVVSSNSIPDGFRDEDGKGVIRIRVTDEDGNEVEREYRINLSDPVNFVCDLRIENSIGAFEILEWGTAIPQYDPTTGSTNDGDPREGKLDTNLCEYELPPLPTIDVFDARWTHPTRRGVIRSIYPDGQGLEGISELFIYKAQIQPGGENGNVSSRYPMTVTWDATCIPGIGDPANPRNTNWYLTDGLSNGEFFSIEMRTGLFTGVEQVNNDAGEITLRITNSAINSVLIVSDIFGDVNDGVAVTEEGITNVSPNPINNEATVSFVLAQAGDVTIEVLDIFGNVVTTLVNTSFKAGENTINWDGKSETGQRLADGAYNIRLVSNGNVSTYPVRLVK